MKIALMLVAVVIAVGPAAYAQSADAKQKSAAAAKGADSGVEQALMKMERDALAAMLKRDIGGFGRIFADDAGKCRRI